MNNKIQSTSLLILATIATAAALSYAREVLIPFVLAIFIAYTIEPVIDLLQRKCRMPRGAAIVSTLFLCLVMASLVGLVIIANIQGVMNGAELYKQNVLMLMNKTADWAHGFGIPIDRESIVAAVQNFPIFDLVGRLGGKVAHIISSGMLTFIFLMFIVSGQSQIQRVGLYAEIDQKIREYLIAKVITSAVTAVLVWIVLLLLGVELAFLFGLLAFILNFIPTLGSIIATLAPLPILLINYPGIPVIVAAIGLPMLIQFVLGNVIEPKLMGQSLDLHPATILLCLMFWGMLWGTVGMILSVPITATLKIVFERLPTTRPITELMAGRLPSAH